MEPMAVLVELEVAPGEEEPDAAAPGRELPRGATPNRLVAFRSALELLGPPNCEAEEDDEEEAEEEDDAAGEEPGVELVDEASAPPRPRSERLPRNCGVRRATKRSAAVTPLSRIVRSTVPVETRAVRSTPVFAGRVVGSCANRFCCQ